MDATGLIMMCKLKGRMDMGGYYDLEIKGWMQKGGNMICKLNGQIDKREHYDVEMKGLMQKGAI